MAIVRYWQFLVDGRAFGSRKRGTWTEAAGDAVRAGYAVWTGPDQISLNDQAEIDSGRCHQEELH